MFLFYKLVFLLIVSVIIGLLVLFYQKQKYIKAILMLFLAICILIVLSITLFDRQILADRSVKLIPGYSFRHIFDYPWTYAKKDAVLANLGNAIMFIPFGMIITYLANPSHPYLLSGAVAFVASTCIEITQYCFQLGSLETDDIIYNTWGAVIGCSIILAVIKRIKSVKANIRTLMPLIVYIGSTGIISILSIMKDYSL